MAQAQEALRQELQDAQSRGETWREAAVVHEGRVKELEAQAKSVSALEARLQGTDERLAATVARCGELEAKAVRLQVRSVL